MCWSFSFSAAGQIIAPQPPIAGPESAIAVQQRSIAVQQHSIEQQRAVAGQYLRSLPTHRTSSPVYPADVQTDGGFASNPFAASRPDCPPVSPMLLQNVIATAANANGVSPDLINAVIHQESGGNPCAVSEKGAMGLMQLMPATAVEMGASEPFDVNQNVTAGTRLLAELMQRYNGDLNRVLGAYNAGPAAVDRSGGTPPFPETIDYIRSVLGQIKPVLDPKLFAPPVR